MLPDGPARPVQFFSTRVPHDNLTLFPCLFSPPSSLSFKATGICGCATCEQVAQTLSAPDSEDARKYLPSLLVRVRWQVGKTVAAAFGIENLSNDKYWNFHPFGSAATWPS